MTHKPATTKSYSLVFLVLLTFFVISLLSNIIGPLVPEIIEDFRLSLTMVALLPFSFFLAYGLMSIPAGMLVEKYGEKKVMLLAFTIACSGALLFAVFPGYLMAILSLFMIGAGMAMLQVVINPLLRTAGGEENLAFYSVMGQLFFGLASFISPLVYSWITVPGPQGNFITSLLSPVIPPGLNWISLYWIFAAISLMMVVVILFFKFPAVDLKEDEKAGAWRTYGQLLKKRSVILFFFGIFFYVGSEQGTANWTSKFLAEYHGYDPQTTGAQAVSWFWGLMTIGTFAGLLLVRMFDGRKVLQAFTAAAMICLTIALFGGKQAALYALPSIGFFASVMWPVILSLSLNSVRVHHGSLSGILITGIAGGAVIPLIIGWLGDLFNLKTGMAFLYLSFSYVFSVGIWAKPLVQNKVFSFMKKRKSGAPMPAASEKIY